MHLYGRLILGYLALALLTVGTSANSAEVVFSPDSTVAIRYSPSPTGAALRSMAFPGWGQMYNGAPVKAVIYGGIEQGLIYGIYRYHETWRYWVETGQPDYAEFYRQQRNRMVWYLAGAVLASMVDAYVDASLYNFDVDENLTGILYHEDLFGSGINVSLGWKDPVLMQDNKEQR